MLRPTLFLGLGTTGGKILTYLRRLMFEEYGHLGLPVFRYVVVETDESGEWTDTELPSDDLESFDRLHVINPVIANTQILKDQIDPSNRAYNEQLVEWLNPALLDIPQGEFNKGATNIRMAGRLCLWENWEKVTGIGGLTGYLNSIIAEENIIRTNDILREYYRRKNVEVDDTVNTNADGDRSALITTRTQNIFVVGSLCGGTCSGMLIDLVYWLRYQLGLWNKQADDTALSPQIYGIFTMIDSALAAEQRNRIFAGNCLGALKEINFYNHRSSIYHVSFPYGSIHEDTNDSPFDYLLLVSPTGKNPAMRFVDQTGQFDLEGLNQMVAMNLFFDVVAGSSAVKEAIRTDWRAHNMYNSPKEDSQYTRSLATFGASMVWYPKYRISGAAGDSIGQAHCEAWLRDVEDKNKQEIKAKEAWQDIINENITKLTYPSGRKPLRDQLSETLEKYRTHLMHSESSEQFRMRMRNIPSQNVSIVDQMSARGEYYRTIENQVSLCEEAFRNALDDLFRREVNNLGFSTGNSLGDLAYFFEALDSLIEEDERRCPADPPSLVVDSIDLEGLRIAESNNWTKYIFLQKKAIEQQKQKIYRKYNALVNDTFRELRNYFLRRVLRNLRAHLGVGVERSEVMPDEYRTIKERLDSIVEKVQACERTFRSDYGHQVEPRKQMNVRIIVKDANNDLEEDARSARNSIRNLNQTQSEQIHNEIMGEDKSLFNFLQLSRDEIFRKIKQVYQRRAIDLLGGFDVAREAQRKLGAELVELARRSNPYQTFDARYKPASLQNLPNLICGKDNMVLDRLKDSLFGEGVRFGRIAPSPLEHILVFYQEEAVFALDDLASARSLEDCYRRSSAQYGHHTHQDPDFFDPMKYQREREVRRWVSMALELIPEEVFIPSSQGYLFEWRDTRGLRDHVNVETELECLITEKTDGCAMCIEKIKDALRLHGGREIVSLINERGDYSEKSEFYNEILSELFGDNIMQHYKDTELQGDRRRDRPAPRPGRMGFGRERDTGAAQAFGKGLSERGKTGADAPVGSARRGREAEPAPPEEEAEEEMVFEDASSPTAEDRGGDERLRPQASEPEVTFSDVQFWTRAAMKFMREIFVQNPEGEFAFRYEGELYPVDQIARADSLSLKAAYIDYVRQKFEMWGPESVKGWIREEPDREENSAFYDKLIQELS